MLSSRAGIDLYCRNTYQVSFRETDTTPQPKKWSAYENPHACKAGKSTRYRTSAQTVLFATSIPGMDSDDSSSFSVATSAAVPFLMQNSELRRCRNRLHKRHRLCSVTSFHCISLLLMIFSHEKAPLLSTSMVVVVFFSLWKNKWLWHHTDLSL